jgi:hypothetical protein
MERGREEWGDRGSTRKVLNNMPFYTSLLSTASYVFVHNDESQP